MYSLNGLWKLATDPHNLGREKNWFETGPGPDAEEATVPGIIQQTFPGYHGVAWYWRTFTPGPAPYIGGRRLLRFWTVDYMADVWLNGVHVGRHEGGETPFVLDVTDAIDTNGDNLLAVRVLNPTNEPIDGIKLQETPHRNKTVPYFTGRDFNHGGIKQAVELLYVPPVRLDDIFLRPDPTTGLIRITATVRNDTAGGAAGSLTVSVAPATGGRTITRLDCDADFSPGESLLETELQIAEPHLWSVDGPYLYRVTARLRATGEQQGDWEDEQTLRCGFRDFRFEDGYFRLNGRRIYLRSAHTGNEYPMGLHVPHDPELLRRDFYYAKTMGFNMVRFIAGMAYPAQLDLCDELGLLVYEESYAGWCLEDSPQMAQRFNRSTAEMVRRDRNHPCVVIWGLLNETNDGPVFRHAVDTLPLVRSLDDTRLVLLNSGRWDGEFSIGSLSNPGSTDWQPALGAEGLDIPYGGPHDRGYVRGAGDAHYYPPVPLSAESIRFFRTLGEDTKPVFLSEHGNGSQVDALRLARLYEQAGTREDLEDYALYQGEAEQYLADWERYGMDTVYPSPGDLLRESQRVQSELRLVGLNAIRSNPHLVGYSLTGLVDQGRSAEGLWTTFRELKPGMMDAIRDGWAPLRWCLFVEPAHGYRGRPFKIEVVLANEDVLLPGEYPARLKIVGPGGIVLDRSTVLEIPDAQTGPEPALVYPVLSEELPIDGPAGRYEIVAYFERGAAPVGGRDSFYVSDSADLPAVETEVTLFGDQDLIAAWLGDRGIRCRRLAEPAPSSREIILVGGLAGAPGDLAAFRELVKRIARGGTAVFLTPKALEKGEDKLGWLPLAQKGALHWTQGWAAGRDDFAKAHPIFDGLPAGGLLDPTFYRDLIPGETFDGQDPPEEVVAGAFAVGSYHPGGYYSGVHIAVYSFGAGRFIVNTLPIMEHLDEHPAADRLLLNIITYAAEATDSPLVPLPPNFESHLARIGYR